MRTDCRHYVRRSSAGGERIENCRVDAAPDAPWSCPEHCPLFEKVSVSRAGWVVGSVGSLDSSPGDDDATAPVPVDAGDLFERLAADFDAGTVARIEAEEKRKGKGRPWYKKRR